MGISLSIFAVGAVTFLFKDSVQIHFLPGANILVPSLRRMHLNALASFGTGIWLKGEGKIRGRD